MTTPLRGSLRREILINEKAYTLTLTEAGFRLSEKRRRSGRGLLWKDLVNGDAQISASLAADDGNPE